MLLCNNMPASFSLKQTYYWQGFENPYKTLVVRAASIEIVFWDGERVWKLEGGERGLRVVFWEDHYGGNGLGLLLRT